MKKEDDEGFLLADRKVSFFVLTATIVASMIGGNSIVTTMSFVYKYGVSVIWSAIGSLLGFLVLCILAVKIKKLSDENRFYTISDFIEKKYGGAASSLTAVIVFAVYVGFLLIQFIAGGIVLAAVSGWSYTFCVLLMGAVVIIYVAAAGFEAVIRTDVFQYLLLFLLVPLAIFLFYQAGAIDTKLLNVFAGGPANIFAFIIYGFISIITGAELWQRIYAGKDIATVKKALIWSGIIVAFLLSVIIFMGLFVNSKFPNIVPETALAVGFSKLLPDYMVGIGLIVLFAAIMSSLDTFLFVLASNINRDFLGKISFMSQHSFAKNTAVYSLVLGILGMVLALYLTSIVDILTSIAGVYFSLFPVIIFSFRYQLKQKAVMLSIFGGALASIATFIFVNISIESALMSFPVSFILLGIGQLIFRKNEA